MLNKQGKWSELGNFPIVGAWYEENFADNLNKPAEIRKESDGSISVKAGFGYNFHFFWDKRIAIDANDILGIVTMVSGRLVLDDPNKPDDRKKSKYIMGSGADYWRDFTAEWLHNEENNAGVGLGRLKKVENEWRKYYMHTLSEEALQKHPIPLELLK